MIRLTLFVAVAILLAACSSDLDQSCPQVLVGRVVNNNFPCAGIAIVITSGEYPAQTIYTDDEGNTYHNAFRPANFCEMNAADIAWLSDPANEGVEFAFYVRGIPFDDLCLTCKVGISLPDTALSIELADGPCTDVDNRE